MYVLETENLSYTYGLNTPFEKAAVKDVSIKVQKGELIGIIGHTGSGKSTLIQMFNGLIRPESGRVLLNGRDIWEDPKKIRSVRFQAGLVFQYGAFRRRDPGKGYKSGPFYRAEAGTVGEISV